MEKLNGIENNLNHYKLNLIQTVSRIVKIHGMENQGNQTRKEDSKMQCRVEIIYIMKTTQLS